MKIIEGLKELKLIMAKVSSNIPIATKYASALDTETLLLKEEKAHRLAVHETVQSSEDLLKRYIHLKTSIDYTNLKVKVPMKNGNVYTIAELLQLKRTVLAARKLVYDSVNDTVAQKRKVTLQQKSIEGAKEAQIIRFYDEKAVDQKRREILELQYEIDGTLEIVNATTDLIEEIS